MSSKTKIIVLHMREIIYTVVFAVLALILILLLFFMFGPKKEEKKTSGQTYTPGTYSSSLTLNNTDLEVEVTVDSFKINSIRFTNLSESVTAMYPLIQPTLEEIADQVYEKQSLENISYSKDNPYTSQIIINAIQEALEKAAASK